MKFFTIYELTKSAVAEARGIDNTPTEEVRKNLIALVDNVLDPLRKAWGKKIIVNSGYRCEKLNKAVGGSSSSQHMRGMAADVTTGSVDGNKWLFEYIKGNLPFDQLIDERGYQWIHVSYCNDGMNRRQVLHL